jgi:hypothetical protein
VTRYPGWAIWEMSGGSGTPLELVYLNHALTTTDSCTLREVGLVYTKWYASDGDFNFRANADGFGRDVRNDLLGLHVFEEAGSAKGSPVMWQDGCETCDKWHRMLSGDFIGVPQLVSDRFTSYEWQQKQLLAQYLPPPPGFTVDDAIPYGWDVYSSVRGADLDFVLRESDIVGIRP